MSDNFAIETRDLTKSYGRVTVVDRLNLHVRENEVFGLLGPNGAGKTTSILMMLGLTEPTAGTVQVCGLSPTRDALRLKRVVGYLPEEVGFYNDLTPRENLLFIAELNKIDRAEAERRIDEALDMVGLGAEKEKTVGKFSRGMRQRLGIADVLIKKPKLVFLDEPTSGLDPKGINQILDIIAGMPKTGTTVLLSSHQLYQVQKVCHGIGILAKGKVVIEGSIDDLGREALAGGGYIIEVETTAPAAELVEALGKLPGVTGVEAEGDALRVSSTADIRAEVAKVVVQSGAPLVQMKVQEFSLDDIYMRYFKEG